MNTLALTQYERRNRQAATDLLFFSYRVNTHLDWYDPARWLDTQEAVICLAWEDRGRGDQHLAGMLAASNLFHGNAWLRLVAVANNMPAEPVLSALSEWLAGILRAQGGETLMVLVTEAWLGGHLPGLGFSHHEDVITLRRAGHELPDLQPAPPVIRPVQLDDLQPVLAVDHAAFPAPWQLTHEELHQALRIAYSCTVALQGPEIVGYQLSTVHRQEGHLARLAVAPNQQGRGIGSALVGDLIRRLLRRSICSLTVNTQRGNHRSRKIYARYGFTPNGHDLPVWRIRL